MITSKNPKIIRTVYYKNYKKRKKIIALKRACSAILFFGSISGFGAIIAYTYPWQQKNVQGSALPYVQGEHIYSFDGDFLLTNTPIPPQLPEWRKESDEFLNQLEDALH